MWAGDSKDSEALAEAVKNRKALAVIFADNDKAGLDLIVNIGKNLGHWGDTELHRLTPPEGFNDVHDYWVHLRKNKFGSERIEFLDYVIDCLESTPLEAVGTG